ncbi:MAG: ion channel [Planctomycetota bacterium]|jgi:hypothetical protein
MSARARRRRRASALWAHLASLRSTRKFGVVCALLALAGLAATFLCVLIVRFAHISPDSPLAVAALLLLLALGPGVTVFSLVLIVGFYKVDHKYLQNIVLSYFTVMLVFTNIYWLLMLVPGRPPLPFGGIHPAWTFAEGMGRTIQLKDALLTCVDCFHFSLATISTLGYGDMVPTAWYSKLICNFEVIIGLGIVVVGFGRFFSKKRTAS